MSAETEPTAAERAEADGCLGTLMRDLADGPAAAGELLCWLHDEPRTFDELRVLRSQRLAEDFHQDYDDAAAAGIIPAAAPARWQREEREEREAARATDARIAWGYALTSVLYDLGAVAWYVDHQAGRFRIAEPYADAVATYVRATRAARLWLPARRRVRPPAEHPRAGLHTVEPADVDPATREGDG